MKSASLMTWLVSSSALLMPSLGNSQQWSFQPRINAGVMNYEYKQENAFSDYKGSSPDGNQPAKVIRSSQEMKRADSIPYIGIGGTVSYDRFFLDLYGSKTATGEDKDIPQITVIDTTWTGGQTTTINSIKTNSKIEREDYSISLGYNLFDNLIIFAGYKKSETDFDDKVFYYNNAYRKNGILVDTFDSKGVLKIKLDQKGPFIGVAYGWNIMDKGVLSVNAALGSFEGTAKQNVRIEDPSDPSQPLLSEFKNKGDVIGLSTGITWRANITDSLAYSLALSGYNYGYEDKNGGGNFSESVLNFSAGLSYRF